MLRPSLYCFVSILTTLSDIHALFLFWPHSVTCMLCFYSDHTEWHTCFVSILITLSDTHALFPFWPHPVTHMLCFHSDQTTHCDTHALFLFWPHLVTHMLCFHSDHTQWHTCFVSILTTRSDTHKNWFMNCDCSNRSWFDFINSNAQAVIETNMYTCRHTCVCYLTSVI